MHTLICANTMTDCRTPGMCSPHGGCVPSIARKTGIGEEKLPSWRDGSIQGMPPQPQGDVSEVEQLRARVAELEAMVKELEARPRLKVWYGSMPESNGKSNFTAILMREGGEMFEGITIERSEYPDRVRYEADNVRWLLGDIPEKPFILDYDADKHSGYKAPPRSE
ncbi:hypothetical protein HNP46_006090 [Pseudomonas nitritireducens]|uniref:Uncharacterized protein n=1 Tax=Pseudomonas nitroreducens TaxID=46680 RepID=A0A7W7KQL1_PSENT|nr:hypothetical protein [Pseudomonas nitritireducens]MBB4867179.1 hypothetical protein [Pseudomonas nitritireducens]